MCAHLFGKNRLFLGVGGGGGGGGGEEEKGRRSDRAKHFVSRPFRDVTANKKRLYVKKIPGILSQNINCTLFIYYWLFLVASEASVGDPSHVIWEVKRMR